MSACKSRSKPKGKTEGGASPPCIETDLDETRGDADDMTAADEERPPDTGGEADGSAEAPLLDRRARLLPELLLKESVEDLVDGGDARAINGPLAVVVLL